MSSRGLDPLVLLVALAAACSSGAERSGRDAGGEESGGSADVTTVEARSEADADLGSATDSVRDSLLDACFDDLPAPVGLQIVADLNSADAKTRVRVALDTMGRTGLAYPWTTIRFGVVADGVVACITDSNQLAYRVTHHNCDDVASAWADATHFELGSPGAPSSELRIFSGSTLVRSIPLTTQSCTRSDGPGDCPRVGPC